MLDKKKYTKVYCDVHEYLKLTGNKAIIYSLIYNFSYKSDEYFTGSYPFISKWTGISERNVIRIIDELVESKLIIKLRNEINRMSAYMYKVDLMILADIISQYKENNINEAKYWGCQTVKCEDEEKNHQMLECHSGGCQTVNPTMINCQPNHDSLTTNINYIEKNIKKNIITDEKVFFVSDKLFFEFNLDAPLSKRDGVYRCYVDLEKQLLKMGIRYEIRDQISTLSNGGAYGSIVWDALKYALIPENNITDPGRYILNALKAENNPANLLT